MCKITIVITVGINNSTCHISVVSLVPVNCSGTFIFEREGLNSLNIYVAFLKQNDNGYYVHDREKQ